MPAPWRLLDGAADPVADYRTNPRKDIVSLVKGEPRLVLDLGCGTGATGELLKKQFPKAKVYGVEPHGPSAGLATAHLDKVFNARLEDVDLSAEGVKPGSVDLVIAADVLEHMVDPWKALRTLRPLLSEQGVVIASLPNARNLPLIWELADQGRFAYATHGVLDVTHLRFFTKAEMAAMFADSGYRIRRQVFVLAGNLAKLYEDNRGKDKINIGRGRFQLSNLTPDELRELCSIQILTIAAPRRQKQLAA